MTLQPASSTTVAALSKSVIMALLLKLWLLAGHTDSDGGGRSGVAAK